MPNLPALPSPDRNRRRADKLLPSAAVSGGSVAVTRPAAASHRLVLGSTQRVVARAHGNDRPTAMAHYVRLVDQTDIEHALVLADTAVLSALLDVNPAAATAKIYGLSPLVMLLRHSTGSAIDVRRCARLLLGAGADPNSYAVDWIGQGRMSALRYAARRRDLELVRLLTAHGATADDDELDALLARDGP